MAGAFFRWSGGRRNEADDIMGRNAPARAMDEHVSPPPRAFFLACPRGRRRDRTCGVREWASGSTVRRISVGVFRGDADERMRNVDRDVPAHTIELAPISPSSLLARLCMTDASRRVARGERCSPAARCALGALGHRRCVTGRKLFSPVLSILLVMFAVRRLASHFLRRACLAFGEPAGSLALIFAIPG